MSHLPRRHRPLRIIHSNPRPRRRTAASASRSNSLAALLVIAFGFWAAASLFSSRPLEPSDPALIPRQQAGTQAASFALCDDGHGGDCVVDGDTFRLMGETIRIADIDTPETHPARCEEEAALGAQATERLQELLNAGPFSLQSIDRDQDRYGRSLRIVMRDGRSIGATLVAEGLARPWEGSRQPWCRS